MNSVFPKRGRAPTPLRPKRCQQGMTLIELMIALLIGLFLIGGIIQLFLNTRQTFLVENALSRLQENGRFAMGFLARDIRMADYRACQTADVPSMRDAANNNIGLNATAGVTYDGAHHATHKALDSPDTITVRWSEADCGVATIQTRGFSINSENLVDTTGAVLVEDVEKLQITYGVDSDGDTYANYYVPGTTGVGSNFPALSDWAKVVSVRVSLLLRSDDNITAEPVSYNYNGEESYPPTDRRLRKVFTSTFVLRNRMR